MGGMNGCGVAACSFFGSGADDEGTIDGLIVGCFSSCSSVFGDGAMAGLAALAVGTSIEGGGTLGTTAALVLEKMRGEKMAGGSRPMRGVLLRGWIAGRIGSVDGNEEFDTSGGGACHGASDTGSGGTWIGDSVIPGEGRCDGTSNTGGGAASSAAPPVGGRGGGGGGAARVGFGGEVIEEEEDGGEAVDKAKALVEGSDEETERGG